MSLAESKGGVLDNSQMSLKRSSCQWSPCRFSSLACPKYSFDVTKVKVTVGFLTGVCFALRKPPGSHHACIPFYSCSTKQKLRNVWLFFFCLLRVEGGGMKALNRRLTVFVVVVEWLNMARLNPPIESWLLLMLRITRELLPRYSMDHQACRHVNNGCVLTPTSKRAIVPRSTSQVCLW